MTENIPVQLENNSYEIETEICIVCSLGTKNYLRISSIINNLIGKLCNTTPLESLEQKPICFSCVGTIEGTYGLYSGLGKTIAYRKDLNKKEEGCGYCHINSILRPESSKNATAVLFPKTPWAKKLFDDEDLIDKELPSCCFYCFSTWILWIQLQRNVGKLYDGQTANTTEICQTFECHVKLTRMSQEQLMKALKEKVKKALPKNRPKKYQRKISLKGLFKHTKKSKTQKKSVVPIETVNIVEENTSNQSEENSIKIENPLETEDKFSRIKLRRSRHSESFSESLKSNDSKTLESETVQENDQNIQNHEFEVMQVEEILNQVTNVEAPENVQQSPEQDEVAANHLHQSMDSTEPNLIIDENQIEISSMVEIDSEEVCGEKEDEIPLAATEEIENIPPVNVEQSENAPEFAVKECFVRIELVSPQRLTQILKSSGTVFTSKGRLSKQAATFDPSPPSAKRRKTGKFLKSASKKLSKMVASGTESETETSNNNNEESSKEDNEILPSSNVDLELNSEFETQIRDL